MRRRAARRSSALMRGGLGNSRPPPCYTQASTKESDVCSNRGVCDTLAGECQCSPEYGTSDGHNNAGNRGDCGYAKDPVTACPGLLGLPDTGLQCSGHGVCADFPTYRCKCNTGWMGSDCSLRECAPLPFGRSHCPRKHGPHSVFARTQRRARSASRGSTPRLRTTRHMRRRNAPTGVSVTARAARATVKSASPAQRAIEVSALPPPRLPHRSLTMGRVCAFASSS